MLYRNAEQTKSCTGMKNNDLVGQLLSMYLMMISSASGVCCKRSCFVRSQAPSQSLTATANSAISALYVQSTDGTRCLYMCELTICRQKAKEETKCKANHRSSPVQSSKPAATAEDGQQAVSQAPALQSATAFSHATCDAYPKGLSEQYRATQQLQQTTQPKSVSCDLYGSAQFDVLTLPFLVSLCLTYHTDTGPSWLPKMPGNI